MSMVVNGDSINNATARVKHDYSTFDLKEVVLATHRFGEYHPHLVIDGISSDKQPWRCIHEARSHTLKAPLMQDIQLHKDYFMVNLRAILPLQAERIIKNPKIGDDVPADAYTSVSNFVEKISSFITGFDSLIANSTQTDALRAETIFKKFVLAESVFSRGSLLASLGCNLSANLLCAEPGGSNPEVDIDDCFDGLIALVNTYLSTPGRAIGVHIDGVYYDIVVKPSSITFGNNPQITMHDFLQRIRDTSDWNFASSFNSNLAGDLITYATDYSFIYNLPNDMPIDLARLWAYHLAVAEYFTDDTVDYIYSADLFRLYINSLVRSVLSGYSSLAFFAWNGSSLQYDYLSSHWFNVFASQNYTNVSSIDRLHILQYFLTLFGFHRSLRYRDYFVGSRTRPLAIPGSGVPLGVPVVNNQVQVINVTKGIQSQRFYNAVNAARDGFSGYLKSLFGVDVPTDAHVPIHLAHTVDGLFASQVENTGDAQQTQPNSVTAIFRSNSSNFEFTARVVENCIIIGVTSYDIERCYPDMVARSFFIRDRYDMFLPQMQYIGDQEVYQHELFSGTPNPFGTAFGYQFRDMQYKQLVNRCEGAINSDKLPGYAFVMKRPFLGEGEHISPDFIRARNAELDDFYLALTGYSLGNYFHFILNQINLSKSARPMTAKPQIL